MKVPPGQIGHLDRLLQRQAGGHDLTKQPRHFLAVQRAVVEFHDATQHLGLTLGTIEHRLRIVLRLGLGHATGTFGALADQAHDIGIELVDALTQPSRSLGVSLIGFPDYQILAYTSRKP